MGHKFQIKCVESRENVNSLSSTGVPFTLTKVHVPNLALIQKKDDNSAAGENKVKRKREVKKNTNKEKSEKRGGGGYIFFYWNTLSKKVSGFPVPSRDVTYQTLPGRE